MDDSFNSDDFESLFDALSDYDHGSRSPSPQDVPMGDPADEPMLEEDSFDEEAVVSLSLAEFVSMAQDIRASNMADFSRFLLTGISGKTQYQVDPIKDTLQDNHQIHALRDFDSVLGLHEDVCVETFLTMCPVSKYSDTLSRNIHIKYSFSNASVRSSAHIIALFLKFFYRETMSTFPFILFLTFASENGVRTTYFAS